MLRQRTGAVCAVSSSRGEASGRLGRPWQRPCPGSCLRRQPEWTLACAGKASAAGESRALPTPSPLLLPRFVFPF